MKLAPSIARLYPTIVLNDTELLNMYRAGAYRPLTTEEAVAITKEMYRIIDGAGINIIRVGLKSTDLITDGGEIQGHTYHPAFRQLVEGELAREQLETQLSELLGKSPAPAGSSENYKDGAIDKSNAHAQRPIYRTADALTFSAAAPPFQTWWEMPRSTENILLKNIPTLKSASELTHHLKRDGMLW